MFLFAVTIGQGGPRGTLNGKTKLNSQETYGVKACGG